MMVDYSSNNQLASLTNLLFVFYYCCYFYDNLCIFSVYILSIYSLTYKEFYKHQNIQSTIFVFVLFFKYHNLIHQDFMAHLV